MKTALLASEAARHRRRTLVRRRLAAASPLLLVPLLWFTSVRKPQVPEVTASRPGPHDPHGNLLNTLAHAGPIIITFPDGSQQLILTDPIGQR